MVVLVVQSSTHLSYTKYMNMCVCCVCPLHILMHQFNILQSASQEAEEASC